MTAAFVLGFVLGGLVGVLVMALCAIAGDSDDGVTPVDPADFGTPPSQLSEANRRLLDDFNRRVIDHIERNLGRKPKGDA